MPFIAMALGLLILSTISILIGAGDMSFDNPAARELLLVSRLPRTIAIILTGASLAISGVILQILVRNRFVEPATTGTTEATMIGLLVVAFWFPDWPVIAKMVVAAGFSVAGLLVFFRLTQNLPPEQPLLIPLVGLIYGGILGAIATYFAYESNLMQYLGTWLTGEFSGVLAGRYELLWIAGVLAVLSYGIADQFSVAGLGRQTSLSLGLNYSQVIAIGVGTVALTSSLVVVTVGVLPFIGLVVPNIVSRFMGDNLRRSLPAVAGLGAILLLIADILGRSLRYPYEIPAGTVFGVIGAVLFLWLLLGRRRENG